MDTKQDITQAIDNSVNGRSHKNVYANVDGIAWRIVAVRTHHKQLQGLRLCDGRWMRITDAFEA